MTRSTKRDVARQSQWSSRATPLPESHAESQRRRERAVGARKPGRLAPRWSWRVSSLRSPHAEAWSRRDCLEKTLGATVELSHRSPSTPSDASRILSASPRLCVRLRQKHLRSALASRVGTNAELLSRTVEMDHRSGDRVLSIHLAPGALACGHVLTVALAGSFLPLGDGLVERGALLGHGKIIAPSGPLATTRRRPSRSSEPPEGAQVLEIMKRPTSRPTSDQGADA